MDTTAAESAAPPFDPDAYRFKFPVARLWSRVGPSGRTYLSGLWGGARVLVVTNPDRFDETDAEFLLVLAPNDRPQPRRPRRTL